MRDATVGWNLGPPSGGGNPVSQRSLAARRTATRDPGCEPRIRRLDWVGYTTTFRSRSTRFIVPHPGSRFPLLLSLPVLAVAALAACFGLDTDLGFQIQQSVVATGRALPQTASAQGRSGTAAITGRIVGNLPCDDISGEVRSEGSDLRVILVMVSGVNGCNGAIPTTFSYVANVLGVESGPRGIIVEHRFEGVDGQAGVVLDTVVDIK